MKKIIFLVVCLVIAVALSWPKKDVVLDFPANSSDPWRTQLVQDIQNAPNDEVRIKMLNQRSSYLTQQLIMYLRNNGYKCPIDTILYRYGSGKAKNVTSKNGKHSGPFKPQPYAVIKGGKCFKDSMYVFILCFNGTFSLTSSDASNIGGGSPRFTIAAGNGINSYVNYKTSIDLAETFHIPIYKGKGWDATNRITPAQARALENQIDQHQITVRVFEGDLFDLGNMTYNGRKRQ